MLEESGRVVAVDAQGVWVESDRTSSCQACSANKGCGQRALAEYAGRRTERLFIENPMGIPTAVGDRVTVGIEEDSFLRASLLLYTLPLLLLFLGGYLGSMYSETEVPAIIGSLCGLILGLLLARGLGQRLARGCRYQPVLIKVI
jgi:sigma-E factor negative regulatory protein RseC